MFDLYFGWIVFGLVIAFFMWLDLFVFHRHAHRIQLKEALKLCAFWISIALIFNLGVFYFKGLESGLNFLAGYLVEYALSVDNLFVFLLIFSYFRVPDYLLHKVLFWGIFGAIVMRAIMIFLGIALIQQFHFLFYIFGLFLIWVGIKFLTKEETKQEISPFIQWIKTYIPATHDYHEDKFFVKQNGKRLATPLFLVLLAVELTDLVFALDSIPAVIGITTDPFIVYTSNVFAILGMRSLFFALSDILKLFSYLHYGLGIILIFIGLKMLISDFIHIPIWISLGFIIGVIALSILISIKNKI